MENAEIQQAIDKLPRLSLNELPTPLHHCPRLSEKLSGPNIYIKRDDLTGLAFGGNKSRYLEFTLAEAVEQGADAVVLSAVVHSNHCRQLAAAAAKIGLKAVVVLRQHDESPMGYREHPTGNYLLDQLFGAEVLIAAPSQLPTVIAEEMERLKREGYKPFTGLSGLRSRVAYIQCALELDKQFDELGIDPQYIYIGSSGNSLAGLVAGFNLLCQPRHLVGVTRGKVGPPQEAAARLAESAREAAEFIGFACTPAPDHIRLDDRHTGPGFGILDPPTRDAIHLLARTEAILLDPAYTGKGFVGFLDHIRQGRFSPDEAVVFVHTGGTPLTFLYGEDLL